MTRTDVLNILNQLTPGLNFIFGPPSIGKTTLCNKLQKINNKVVHATFDIMSQDAGELGDQTINELTLKTVKDVIALMKKNGRDIIYVVDIHPYFFKVISPLIKNVKSITMTLLTSKFPNKGEALLRYASNGGGDPGDVMMKYHEEFNECFHCALSVLKPKKNKTISLHKNFVTVKL